MFLHVSVILFTGGVSRQREPPRPGRPPPTPPGRRENPPSQGDPPGRENHPPDQADPPRQADPPARQGDPQSRENPPVPGRPPCRENLPRTRQTPPGSRLQNTVYERPVRILLECFLVFIVSTDSCCDNEKNVQQATTFDKNQLKSVNSMHVLELMRL